MIFGIKEHRKWYRVFCWYCRRYYTTFSKMSQSFPWYLTSLRLRGSWHSSRKSFIGKYPHLKELSKGTKVFSNDGRQDLINALSNISSVRVLVCSPYIFVVCRLANGCYNRHTLYEIPTWWRWQWYRDSISKHWELFIMDYPKIEFKWRQSFSAPELPWLSEVYCTCSLSAPFFLLTYYCNITFELIVALFLSLR